MSILIKGLDMPKHCADNCPLMDNGRCWGVKNQPEPVVIAGHRPSWCPLVEVKTPHGRLIDANELEELFRETITGIAQRTDMQGAYEHMVRASAMVVEMIKDAPTVIESEE